MQKVAVIGGDKLAKKLLLKLAMTGYTAVVLEDEPIKIKTIDRRYLNDNVVITKPEQPNFVIFQNNFKRNRR